MRRAQMAAATKAFLGVRKNASGLQCRNARESGRGLMRNGGVNFRSDPGKVCRNSVMAMQDASVAVKYDYLAAMDETTGRIAAIRNAEKRCQPARGRVVPAQKCPTARRHVFHPSITPQGGGRIPRRIECHQNKFDAFPGRWRKGCIDLLHVIFRDDAHALAGGIEHGNDAHLSVQISQSHFFAVVCFPLCAKVANGIVGPFAGRRGHTCSAATTGGIGGWRGFASSQ